MFYMRTATGHDAQVGAEVKRIALIIFTLYWQQT